jgi:excisionase family DNA binding protein
VAGHRFGRLPTFVTVLRNFSEHLSILPQVTRHAQASDQEAPVKHLLSIRETAEELGISATGIQRLIRNQRLPVIRIGRRTLIDPSDIDSLIEQYRVCGKGARVRRSERSGGGDSR